VTGDTRPTRPDEEIAELFARRPDPDARQELAKEFLPLAEYFARRFSGRGEPVDDLTQTASLGLLNAIDRFDPDRGVPFSTYAAATIVGELKRHFRDRGWALRVPRNVQETAILVNRTVSTLWQDLGRAPTVAEIATTADISEDDVLQALDALQAYTTDSLDAATRRPARSSRSAGRTGASSSPRTG
jgi:RNA polymerase sigma-B factor